MATPAAAAAPKGAVADTYQRILDSIAPNAGQLKRNYNGYLARGLVVAAVIHLAGIGAYWAFVKATEVEVVETEDVIQVEYADIEPPSIEDAPPPPDAAPPPPAAAAVPSGTPTPVPDDEAPPDQTIATQEELSTSGPATSGSGVGVIAGTGPVGPARPPAPPPPPPPPPPPATPPPAPPPPPPDAPLDFSEVQPTLVGGIERLQQSIQYPDFERRAGVEGRVIVAFVVDENGVPSIVAVARGVSPGLDQAAVQAVQRARFTPGQQNGRPVKVRFTLPVTFRITSR